MCTKKIVKVKLAHNFPAHIQTHTLSMKGQMSNSQLLTTMWQHNNWLRQLNGWEFEWDRIDVNDKCNRLQSINKFYVNRCACVCMCSLRNKYQPNRFNVNTMIYKKRVNQRFWQTTRFLYYNLQLKIRLKHFRSYWSTCLFVSECVCNNKTVWNCSWWLIRLSVTNKCTIKCWSSTISYILPWIRFEYDRFETYQNIANINVGLNVSNIIK